MWIQHCCLSAALQLPKQAGHRSKLQGEDPLLSALVDEVSCNIFRFVHVLHGLICTRALL